MYQVIKPLIFSGKRFQKGEKLESSNSVSIQSLLRSKHIEKIDTKKAEVKQVEAKAAEVAK